MRCYLGPCSRLGKERYDLRCLCGQLAWVRLNMDVLLTNKDLLKNRELPSNVAGPLERVSQA